MNDERHEEPIEDSGELRRAFDRWILAIVAATVVGLLTFFSVSVPLEKERFKLQRANHELQSRADELARSIQELEQERAETGERIRLLRAASLDLIPLRPSSGGAARGRVLWNAEERRGVLIVRDLAPAPMEREYQLWLTTGSGRRIPVLIFETDDEGRLDRSFEAAEATPDVAGALVTDEPGGGPDRPTGPVRLAGTVTRSGD